MAIEIDRKVEQISSTSDIMDTVEFCGRTCYKSEQKGNPKEFISRIVKSGHESVLEHGNITYLIVCDRATSHQIVRHRMFSYSQASQRYCNYSKDKFGGEIQYIVPLDIPLDLRTTLKNMVNSAEKHYFDLLNFGMKPEVARCVLPNCCATEVTMTGNIRAWRNFLKTRLDKHAQSDIIDIARMIVKDMDGCGLSVFIEDLGGDNENS